MWVGSPAKVRGVVDREAPVRRDPWDRLKPRDFVRDNRWPGGRPVEPEQLKESGLTEQQRLNHALGMNAIRQLALDYERYRSAEGLTHEEVAAATGLSRGAIRHLRDGTRIPSTRTSWVLRAFIPTNEQMDEEYGTRRRRRPR